MILIATLTPRGDSASGDFLGVSPTAWHVVLFALLGASIALRYAASSVAARSPARVLLMVVMALWLFAAGTELAQRWIDGRQPALEDWFADMAGALIGLVLGSTLLRLMLARGR